MKKGLIIGIVAVIACCAVAFGVHHEMRRTAQMRASLVALQAANQADSVFTTDSLALKLVRYFDHPLHFWTSANDRLMAHYLLGRCYADMGEAPRAIEEYSEAVEQADTTASDCDLRTLRAVYGQMANVFHQQNLPEEEIEAEQRYIHYSNKMGDSLQIAIGMENLTRPYYLIGDSDAILRYSHAASEIFYSIGRSDLAANALNTSAFIETQRGNTAEARWLIDLIRQESSFFDSHGNLRPGREMFYYTIGLYFENSNKLDSAEYYYRRLLPAHEYEAAYRGLLSVYEKREIADSIGKFARLYADANDAAHDEMRTDAVILATKNFKYTRQQQLAQRESRRANTFRFALVMLLAVMIIVGLQFMQYSHKKSAERRKQLATYRKTLDDLDAARRETELLQQSLSKNDATRKLLKEKEDQIGQLEMIVKELQKQIGKSAAGIHIQRLKETGIVKKFQAIAHPHPDMAAEGNRCATETEWDRLTEAIRTYHPSLYLFIHKNNLSELKYKVCILSYLGFDNAEISTLTKASLNSISNARTSLARELFNLRSARELNRYLHEI